MTEQEPESASISEADDTSQTIPTDKNEAEITTEEKLALLKDPTYAELFLKAIKKLKAEKKQGKNNSL